MSIANQSSSDPPANLIEIGLIVVGTLDEVDRPAVKVAVNLLQSRLKELFPELTFQFSTLRRPEFRLQSRVEPSRLLQQAVEDRNSQRWDFAFVVTAAEIVSNYSPFAFAALSRPTDAAVLSTSLIDPLVIDANVGEEERIERISQRLFRLMVHAIGHLNGLAASEEPDNAMFHPSSADGLERMHRLNEDQLREMGQTLAEVADQRLEESVGRSVSFVSFATRAAWINRREIGQAIIAARPWQLPGRLSGLSIASVSTLAILLMTAEAWDLGLSQGLEQITMLVLLALIATTTYVVLRQQLLIRRGRQISEQTVMMSISAFGIVGLGMLVTWIGLCTLAAVVAGSLFSPELVAGWAASAEVSESTRPAEHITNILQMSCFCAALGLLIGSLGTSFESKSYFRHMIFVDEEI